MASDSQAGSESNALPHYAAGSAPRHMFTKQQLWDKFGLFPDGPVRATVDSQHGPAALYQVNEARLPGQPAANWTHPDA